MDDAGILRVLELLLKERVQSLRAARTEDEMQSAAEFKQALEYIQSRISVTSDLEAALAPFLR